MKISDALAGIQRLAIETAPLIYFIEKNPIYLDRMRVIMRLIDEGAITGVSSVITLTEVLTQPAKIGNHEVKTAYRKILVDSRNFELVSIDVPIAEYAADLRARYSLKTPDALQVAAAIHSGCDALLTNDFGIRRVTELRVLILDDLEPDENTLE